MTSTEKFSGLSIVPWYNSSEWKHVYNLVFGPNSNDERKQEAINIILMWQIRCALLPSGVEGTLSVLEAMLATEADLSNRQYCTILSSSLIRFLNICVAKRSIANTFTLTAKCNNIPDWIIDLRHQIAHGQKLPAISMLKLALNECFKWLKVTYWLPEMQLINDHYITKKTIASTGGNCDYLSIYCDLINCYFNDSELSIEICDELKEKGFNPWKLSLDDIMDGIYNILEASSLDLEREFVLFIIGNLIHGNCFISKPEELLKTDVKKYESIENLIVILYKNKALTYFVDVLGIIINDKFENDNSRETASLWLNEIFKGLSLCKNPSINQDINGIHFKKIDETAIEDILSRQNNLFKNINKSNKLCFDSFVLLSSGRLSKKDNDDYLKSFEKAMNYKANKKMFDEIDDCVDLTDQIFLFANVEFSERFKANDAAMGVVDDFRKDESCDLSFSCDSNKNLRTTKWVREKRTHLLESYPLGVLPAEL